MAPSFFPGFLVRLIIGFRRIVIGGFSNTRGKVLARHTAADDAGKPQGDIIDFAQRLGIGTVRSAVIVGRDGMPLSIRRVRRRHTWPPVRWGLRCH